MHFRHKGYKAKPEVKDPQGICEFVGIFACLQMPTKVVPFVHLPVCLREMPQERIQRVNGGYRPIPVLVKIGQRQWVLYLNLCSRLLINSLNI